MQDSPPPRLGRWTLLRVLAALLFVAHWGAVLVFTLPDSPVRQRALEWKASLPGIDTHRGKPWFFEDEVSPIVAYLATTGQGQQWRMFTPRRRVAMQLQFRIESADGSTELVTLRELEPFHFARWTKWRLMEWILLGVPARNSYLPRVAVELARRHQPEAVRVVARKLSYRVPVFEDDGSGAPVFTSAAEFEAFLADRDNLQVEVLGRYRVPPREETP